MNGSLYLFPPEPDAAPEAAAVLGVCEALALGAEEIASSSDARVFRAGPGFAREVVFAGCSPHLRFAPREPSDRDFCHLALIGPLDAPALWLSAQPGRPRCPHCRARLDDGAARAAEPLARHPCPACRVPLRAVDLDWRQRAATGRLLLELRNVFPGEATPSDRLLQALREATGFGWRHGWARMSGPP